MKKNLLFLFSIVFASKLLAQPICSVTIAPNPGHVKISNSQTLTGTGTIYWLCSGITVTVNGSSGSTFLLEQNVHLIFNGSSGDAVFAKPSCTVTNNTGQSISVSGNTTNVTRVNTSTGTLVAIQCPTITYDYSFVGGTACTGVTGIEEQNNVMVYIGPNPIAAGDDIRLNYDWTGNMEARITDITGKTLLFEQGELRSLSTQNLVPGIYFLQLQKSGATQTLKIILH